MTAAKIALVSFDSLGDSLIYIMMAENLRINGYDLTLYSHIANQIKYWMPHLNIKPYPATAHFDEELKQYDLAIVSPPSFLRKQMTDDLISEMKKKWVLICQKTPSSWQYDHTERLSTTLTPEKFNQLKDLANCSGSIRYKRFPKESVVEITLEYMKEKMQLSQLVSSVNISPPPDLTYRRFDKRIIVSPDSAGPESKNWTASAYLKLCHTLKQKGYEPVIVVSPGNHAAWKAMQDNVYETPLFEDINKLAGFIFESGALIANDSGNGHLASFLNIPVITIYKKINKNYHWRPGWNTARVVCPSLSLPWLGGERIWKPFVRPSAIIKTLEEII